MFAVIDGARAGLLVREMAAKKLKAVYAIAIVTAALHGTDARAQELEVMSPEQARNLETLNAPARSVTGGAGELPIARSFEELEARRRPAPAPAATPSADPAAAKKTKPDPPAAKTAARPKPQSKPKPPAQPAPAKAKTSKTAKPSAKEPRAKVSAKPPLPRLKPPRDTVVTVEIIQVGPPVSPDPLLGSAVGVEVNPDDDEDSGVSVVDSFSGPQPSEPVELDRR